jgi:cytochrome c553
MPRFARLTLAAILAFAQATAAAQAAVNGGSALVAQNGCQSCHGANLRGGPGYPALYGIEHRLTHDQIVAALLQPKAPMPNYGFTAAQASDIARYLADLDGGPTSSQPTIHISPEHPSDYAVVTVRFAGTPPAHVSATATMAMGGPSMTAQHVTFVPTSDPHEFQGRLTFGMGGSWMIHIIYDGKTLDRPIVVGQ